MIERHELEAWLGPAMTDLTTEQVERLHREAEAIAARYPDPDDADAREAALIAATQYLLGELSVEEAARQLREARAVVTRASVVAQQIATMLHADGLSEVDAARAAGITRRTLRIALGKGSR